VLVVVLTSNRMLWGTRRVCTQLFLLINSYYILIYFNILDKNTRWIVSFGPIINMIYIQHSAEKNHINLDKVSRDKLNLGLLVSSNKSAGSALPSNSICPLLVSIFTL